MGRGSSNEWRCGSGCGSGVWIGACVGGLEGGGGGEGGREGGETSTVTTPVRALFGHKECRLADAVVGTVEDEEEESSEDLARFGPQRDGGWYRSGSDAAAAAAAWAPGGAGAGADAATLAPCEGSLLPLRRDLLTDARGTCHHTAQHKMCGRRRTALANTACTSNGRALEQRQSPCESPLPRSLASLVPRPAPARGPFLFWFGT